MTPLSTSSESPSWLKKSARLLGWDLIRSALAYYVHSPATLAICESLQAEDDFDTVCLLNEETDEICRLISVGSSFPLTRFEDLDPILEKVSERQIIESVACLSVLKFLRLGRSILRSIGTREEFPRLRHHADRISPLPELLKELERCIDEDGEIRDDASPELKQAIKTAQLARQKLEDQVRRMLANSNVQASLQDNYFTEREERIVLPVRADRRSTLDGIVHDSSASGQTVYMEPTALVPLNNQLKIARLTIEHEKTKILQALAQRVLEEEYSIRNNQKVLTALDLIQAKGSLAGRMNAVSCKLNQNGKMHLLEARNPELILNEHPVVANSLCWEEGTQAIIISGPNTGGKTVTLKTLGLFSLMIRAGLRLPVAIGSEIPFYPQVFADIGDDQNIRESLSTFSAHLEKIIYVMNQARPGTLVLLDELGIATDPQEGAALAEAILLYLQKKGAVAIVSTHYLEIKMLAQIRKGFINACAEFNPETLSPTYRLLFGAPGQSAALDTAERLGLPSEALQKAREIYSERDNRADSTLQELTRQRIELENKEDALNEQLRAAEKYAEDQKTIVESLREKQANFNKDKNKRMQTLLREAKFQVRKYMLEAKENRSAPALKKIEKKLDALGRPEAVPLQREALGWSASAKELKSGDTVLLSNLGARGILMEDPADKKKVRVKMGNIVTLVETKNLRGSDNRQVQASRPAPGSVKIHIETPGSSSAVCDLRGMDSDDALNTLESFMSRAILSNLTRLTLIHGHGRGTIKSLVRDYLATAGVCKSWNPAEQYEGGDGATIVEMD
ncbi:MAG: endonuclease MutS2 [Nitrospinae bacterium CG11_big_fil_rev_8_21_14_0_20_45_15]|nr:MAG: endonuclease MutS2 [Nitrospinae bacterium CG11_big_fil_rev_8_21_14_0_20_45_15]